MVLYCCTGAQRMVARIPVLRQLRCDNKHVTLRTHAKGDLFAATTECELDVNCLVGVLSDSRRVPGIEDRHDDGARVCVSTECKRRSEERRGGKEGVSKCST